jgi:hypothetical protein
MDPMTPVTRMSTLLDMTRVPLKIITWTTILVKVRVMTLDTIPVPPRTTIPHTIPVKVRVTTMVTIPESTTLAPCSVV